MPDVKVDTNLIVVDIETTGLSIQTDQIIEVALLPVSPQLVPLHEGFSVVVNWGGYNPVNMDPYVLNMHTENGLLAEVPSGMWPYEAENVLLDYVSKFGDEYTIPMCGSTVHFDREFLKRDMPELEAWFFYRNFDISTVKQMWARWLPGQGEPPKKDKAHRALDDCHESLAELVWYYNQLKSYP